MRPSNRLLTAGLITIMVAAACKRDLVLHTGNASTAPAAATVKPVVVTFAAPLSSALFAPAALELLRDLNADIGSDTFIVPTPLVKPTSSLTFAATTPATATTGCSGAPITGSGPAMTLVMDETFAAPYATKLGHLEHTVLYAAFARCIGAGLGLPEVTDEGSVMGPNPAAQKDYQAFNAVVRKVLAASSATPFTDLPPN